MSSVRRSHSAAFKGKVALEALKQAKTGVMKIIPFAGFNFPPEFVPILPGVGCKV